MWLKKKGFGSECGGAATIVSVVVIGLSSRQAQLDQFWPKWLM